MISCQGFILELCPSDMLDCFKEDVLNGTFAHIMDNNIEYPMDTEYFLLPDEMFFSDPNMMLIMQAMLSLQQVWGTC